MKTCFKCLKTLPLSEFYPHAQMKSGFLGKCKKCTRRDAEERRRKKSTDKEWLEKESERQRKKNSKMNHEFREIATARRAVRKLGRSKEFHWHHWSYLKEHYTDVIKLTPDRHRLAHRHMVYDRERMQYRESKGMALLDSREKHEAFINCLHDE